LLPVLCVLAGLLISLATVTLDRALGFQAIPRWLTGGPDAALEILATIAVSMVSLATLVLTITMVVVQLAMGQFSPRIVQTFLRDKPSQLAIGLFVATFAHAMVTMREVRFDGEGQVPGISIAVGYLLVLSSIAMLVIYVHHIGQSLRVSALIELVGSDTRRSLDEQYPDALPRPADDVSVVAAPESGVVVSIDRRRLVELAAAADCVVHVMPAIGSFVPAGAPLLRIEGDVARLDRTAAVAALSSALERNLDEDVAYGFRMLVDMSERALSDSPFLDPTTAVQALDRLHDGLRQLAWRVFPDGQYRDDAGALRLTVPVMDWEAYVELAFTEIRIAGAESPQVSRRLAAALDDLIEFAPHDRRAPLEHQLQLLQLGVAEGSARARNDDFALVPDWHGIGVSADRDGDPETGSRRGRSSDEPRQEQSPSRAR
jgi:uncharacterized membrane protein